MCERGKQVLSYHSVIEEIITTPGQNPLYVDVVVCEDIIAYLCLVGRRRVELSGSCSLPFFFVVGQQKRKVVHSCYLVRDVYRYLFGDITLVLNGVCVLVIDSGSSEYLLRGIARSTQCEHLRWRVRIRTPQII